MRRHEILDLLEEVVVDEFDDESSGAFDFSKMDEIARLLVDQNVRDEAELRDIIGTMYKHAPDRELDQLQDGDHPDPNGWLLNQLKESLR